jgi:hypothetical protein
MIAKNERDPKAPKQAPDAPAPRKRFRIEKLEERIAPKKGGKGTNNCSFGDSSDTYSLSSVSAY